MFVTSAVAYALAPALIACTNCSWKAAACALRAWYPCAWAPNKAATAAEISSAPAANTDVVGNAASTFAWVIDEPKFARSAAAALTNSVEANTYDIRLPPDRHPWTPAERSLITAAQRVFGEISET
ncbi:hypothetical protein MPRG_00160 [Mycobacterium paragordonae]|uniref:Uncharacterized protein n=1 Tax=Mycobacterium paragordonae TaxID=1389713 RepID=A0ABQ1BX77_9MYCO|nr:hypothetical protein MPRG_00160 [Mycobacterium paragordonae]